MGDVAGLGALLALASAAIWGAGDFLGGLAGRRLHAFQVSALAGFAGLCAVMFIAVFTGEAWPSGAGTLWALLAGVGGGLGIALLYRGLSTGSVPIVASVSSFVGAGMPVAVGTLFDGIPSAGRLAGFGLGLIAIVLISLSGNAKPTRANRSFAFGLLAGLGFGAFFICMARTDTLFTALVLARLCTLLIALMLIAGLRLPMPSPAAHPLALLVGLLDAAGNALYAIARQYTRLDVAAVLSSMYPASTIALSAIFLRERITPLQGAGIVLCLVAIGLIVA